VTSGRTAAPHPPYVYVSKRLSSLSFDATALFSRSRARRRTCFCVMVAESVLLPASQTKTTSGYLLAVKMSGDTLYCIAILTPFFLMKTWASSALWTSRTAWASASCTQSPGPPK
jgi:hypothetical protein